MKTILSAIALSAALAAPALAQDHAGHAGHGAAPVAATSNTTTTTAATATVMTAGVITRVDTRSGKLTIRHEEIKNLDMPPMTMVFSLADSAKPSDFNVGDKVLFHAEDRDGALIITRIQPAS